MKQKRMGMARIDGGHLISHPYLHASSTMVSSSPPYTRNNLLHKESHQGLGGSFVNDVFLDEPNAFVASARPRPHPPKFNAEALNALAGRTNLANSRSPRSTRSPLYKARLQPKDMNVDMSASPSIHRAMSPAAASQKSSPSKPANDIDFFAPSPPSRPCTPAHRIRAPFRRVASPASSASPSPLRRRSSAAFNSSPFASPQQYKANGEASVDRALGGMLHSLRVAAHHATPSPKQPRQYSSPLISRWSSSEDERGDKTSSTGHSWFSRKSNESSRAKHAPSGSVGNATTALTTILSRRSSRKAPSLKSSKSCKSLKSSKSSASIRSIKSGMGRGSSSMDMDVDVPPIPAVPAVPPAPISATTPSRGRRMVELLKRLTPRKNKHEQARHEQSDATKNDGNAKPTPARGLTRSRTAPSLASVAAGQSMPPPPVPRMPNRLPSATATSHATIKSVISRKMSSTTLRLGKAPRNPSSSPHPPRSTTGSTMSSAATSVAPSTGTSRPPFPAFDAAKLPKAPSTPQNKNRRSASVHLPPPLHFAAVNGSPPSTPPRTSTPSTPRAGTPVAASTPNTPRSPRSPTSSSPSHAHRDALVRSLSRGSRPSADMLDMHGTEGCVPHPKRQSRLPMPFAFGRRSTMSMSLSSSAASSALHLPSLSTQGSSPTPSPGPVLMPRASYFEPRSPSAPLLPPTSPSPSRQGSSSVRSRRTLRNVKSTIGLPTLVSTTSETAFTALTGRPASMLPPWASDAMEVVTTPQDENKEAKPDKPAVPPISITAEPDVFESSARCTLTKVTSLNVPFPGDAASLISTDSCDDTEVITFATPQRARRATATTVFSLNAVKALANISPPSTPPDSPTSCARSVGGSPKGSPKMRSMLRTLEKLEAAHKDKTSHARTDSTDTTGTSGTASGTPALCRTTSDVPSVTASESDGITTPPLGTPYAEPQEPSQRLSHERETSPTPKATPLATTEADSPLLASFSADFTAPPHASGTLMGKAARAAALAAANDPLKPRRLLQLLPRQQTRLAAHRREGMFDMDVDKKEIEAEAEVEAETKTEAEAEPVDTQPEPQPEATPEVVTEVIDLSDDITMAHIDPEIGLPIPPAPAKTDLEPADAIPAHLDRRMRADSAASRAPSEMPRRWPAWPPVWEHVRPRAGTATSVATFGAGSHTPGPASPTVPQPEAAETLKRGHAPSASVNTFGGSHCSGASIANLEEFAQRRKASEVSLADDGVDFTRPRAGTGPSWRMDVDGTEFVAA